MENREKELEDVIVVILHYLNEIVHMWISGEQLFNF